MTDIRLPYFGYTKPVKHACIRCGRTVNGILYLLCDECSKEDWLKEAEARAIEDKDFEYTQEINDDTRP